MKKNTMWSTRNFAALLIGGALLVGCQDDTMEEAGEDADEAVEELKDEVDDATDDK